MKKAAQWLMIGGVFGLILGIVVWVAAEYRPDTTAPEPSQTTTYPWQHAPNFTGAAYLPASAQRFAVDGKPGSYLIPRPDAAGTADVESDAEPSGEGTATTSWADAASDSVTSDSATETTTSWANAASDGSTPDSSTEAAARWARPASTTATADPAANPALTAFYHQHLDWGSCAEFDIDPDANAPMQCAYLLVPADYNNPTGPTVAVAVSKVDATGDAQGDLFVNPGGPGFSGLSLPQDVADELSDQSPQIRASFNLIGFAPRGVGESLPQIRCVGTSTWQAYVSSSSGVHPHSVDGYDEGPNGVGTTEETQDEAFASFLAQRCRQYTAEGFEGLTADDVLAHSSSADVVRDMDVLRGVLGEDTLNYLGYSYGTVLGQEYTQIFPHRVRAMILDSNVDPGWTNPALYSTHRADYTWTAGLTAAQAGVLPEGSGHSEQTDGGRSDFLPSMEAATGRGLAIQSAQRYVAACLDQRDGASPSAAGSLVADVGDGEDAGDSGDTGDADTAGVDAVDTSNDAAQERDTADPAAPESADVPLPEDDKATPCPFSTESPDRPASATAVNAALLAEANTVADATVTNPNTGESSQLGVDGALVVIGIVAKDSSNWSHLSAALGDLAKDGHSDWLDSAYQEEVQSEIDDNFAGAPIFSFDAYAIITCSDYRSAIRGSYCAGLTDLWPDAGSLTPVSRTADPGTVLVVDAVFDPATPFAWSVATARTLGARMIAVAGQQHTITWTGPTCVGNTAANFLLDPPGQFAVDPGDDGEVQKTADSHIVAGTECHQIL